ncbi:MAG: hypothetical protein HN641_13540 [Candidatus Marinimicrobia bacterium]|jgi:hypothetical protein|nr:hypothetical protein [Candidatus Neomarinimicrobiota bacterium]
MILSNVNEVLHQFVREALASGQSRESLNDVLIEANWPEDQVSKAINSFADIDFPIPIPKPAPYTPAKEAFIYLLLFTTLIITAISVGNLLFEYINKGFPDLARSGISHRSDSSIRMSLALTVISFPIYIFFTYYINRRIKSDRSNRNSKIRKWLTYITLFIAAGFVIGDLTTIVYKFLGGEMTLRFILKFLSVGGIAGTIFSYYIWDLNKDEVDE